MSEVDNVEVQETEREALERQAAQMGLKYHPSISDDKLRERVAEAREGTGSGAKDTEDKPVSASGKAKAGRSEALALDRVRVTCMNPNKKEWDGEVFCTGNSELGTVKKFVPFETEWHVPRVILNMIKRRQYQTFVTKKTPNGGKVKTGKLVREFAVEELPPLTEKELAELKQRQLMAAGQAD
jgi:hypothetical protein